MIHYRLLQQALVNVLRFAIRCIHRALRFRQSTWLEPYVSLNTELWRQAQSKIEVELFKLLVNSVYGFSFMNLSNQSHIYVKKAHLRKDSNECRVLYKVISEAKLGIGRT